MRSVRARGRAIVAFGVAQAGQIFLAVHDDLGNADFPLFGEGFKWST
jgi:hypothetical protein